MTMKMLYWWVIGSTLSSASAQLCKNLGATCSSCSTVSICVAINTPEIQANCSRPTPYCNAGACSAVPGSRECGNNFTSFSCPDEDGTYPDGSSCNMYHICLNGTAYNYSCPVKNSVYSPGSGSCVRETKLRCCHKVNCQTKTTYAVYPGDHSLFFLCVNSKPTLVLRCAKGLRFNEAQQTCTVNCEKEGKIADPKGNSTKFVECTLTGPATFAAVLRTCPASSIFNENVIGCVLPQSYSSTQTSTAVTDGLGSKSRKLHG